MVFRDYPSQELENELADCVEELRAAQRKLIVARTASSDAKLSSAASGGASTAAPAVKRCVCWSRLIRSKGLRPTQISV